MSANTNPLPKACCPKCGSEIARYNDTNCGVDNPALKGWDCTECEWHESDDERIPAMSAIAAAKGGASDK